MDENEYFLPISHVSKVFYQSWLLYSLPSTITSPLGIQLKRDLSIDLLNYFIDQGMNVKKYSMRMCIVAIMHGDSGLLKCLFDENHINDASHDLQGDGGRDLCTMAAASGNLKMLCFLRGRLPAVGWNAWVPDILLEAYENNHINIAQYIRAVTQPAAFSVATCQAFPYGEGMPSV